ASKRHPPSHEVPPGLFNHVFGLDQCFPKLDLAIWRQAQQASKLVSVIPDDLEESRNPPIKVIVDFDRNGRLVEQDRGSTSEGFNIGLVPRKVLDDAMAQIAFP